MSERELVALARELFSTRIGDDAAIVDGQVLTTDMLIEDVDFTRDVPLPRIARKALAVNLSDLAAMGATPTIALVALGLPTWARDGAGDLMRGLAAAAKEFGIEIVGGDLSQAEKLVIAVTAIGRAGSRSLLRSGAKRGDRIYLSRPIGGSATGLALLQSGWPVDGSKPNVGYAEREFALSAIARHLDPDPETVLGIALAQIDEVTACIDVSDGLSTDLHNLCEASRCGAEVARERIPMLPELVDYAPRLGVRAQDAVLNGGEEYALLFTSSLRESELCQRLGRPVYAIGRITAGPELVLTEDGVPRQLPRGGYDHFSGGGC